MTQPPSAPWLSTATVAPGALTAERLQLHYAAWILGSVADALLPARDDDSHSNLGITDDGTRLVTHPLTEDGSTTLELVFETLELELRRDGRGRAALPLAGVTMDAALLWVGEVVGEDRSGGAAIPRREYPDFPEHPLGEGAAFADGDPTARVVVGRWFANARSVLGALLSSAPGASALRVWPHHFDLGSVVPLEPEGQRSVGVGLSPGDATVDEPYFYLSPWPYPDPTGLPDLPAPGFWHTRGFTAAVLLTSRLPAGDSDAARVTTEFLNGSLRVQEVPGTS